MAPGSGSLISTIRVIVRKCTLEIISCVTLLVIKSVNRPKPTPSPATGRPTSQQTSAAPGGGKLCIMCTTDPIAVTFHPCGHQVACSQCSARMKQCFSCHERIQEKVRVDIREYRHHLTDVIAFILWFSKKRTKMFRYISYKTQLILIKYGQFKASFEDDWKWSL